MQAKIDIVLHRFLQYCVLWAMDGKRRKAPGLKFIMGLVSQNPSLAEVGQDLWRSPGPKPSSRRPPRAGGPGPHAGSFVVSARMGIAPPPWVTRASTWPLLLWKSVSRLGSPGSPAALFLLSFLSELNLFSRYQSCYRFLSSLYSS